MAIRLINYVNNQQSSPALYTGIFSQRPPAGIGGRLFMSIDTQQIYQDLTTSWQLLADAGSGSGSLESVTANGNSTTYGMTVLANNFSLTNASSNFNYKAITTGSILFSADSSGLISQDNSNFFWDNTSKRLGIGTATPSAKLDVHSSSNTTAIFNGTGVTNGVATFQSAGTSKWSLGNYVSSTVANDFVVYDNVNTTPRLLIHNTGVINIPSTLIIGTTTPTSSFALDVTGSGNFSSSLLVGTTITGNSFIPNGATIPTNGMYLSAANTLAFSTNSTNRILISSTGTATFSSTLQVGSSSGGASIISTANAGTNPASFSFVNSGGTSYIGAESSGGSSLVTGDTAYDLVVRGPSGITFSANNGASPNMRITSGGNVGIGTNTSNASSGYKMLRINGTSGGEFTLANNEVDCGYMYANGGGFYIDALGNFPLVFRTNSGQRMTITSGGSVQIGGTYGGTSKLYIVGTNSTSSDTTIICKNSSLGDIFYTRNDGFINVGTFTYNNAVTGRSVLVESGGGLGYLVSTRESKSNIESIKNIDFINQLNPVQFNYRKKDHKTNKFTDELETNITYGFIADEVEKVNKELVFYNTDGVTLAGVEYNSIIAILTKAVQELNEKLVKNNIN